MGVDGEIKLSDYRMLIIVPLYSSIDNHVNTEFSFPQRWIKKGYETGRVEYKSQVND